MLVMSSDIHSGCSCSSVVTDNLDAKTLHGRWQRMMEQAQTQNKCGKYCIVFKCEYPGCLLLRT